MKKLLYRVVWTVLCIGVGAYGALTISSSPARSHPYFLDLPRDRPVVIAHRGGADLWPENTIEAFQGALALGSDVLEMDIYATADGVPVVIHDETVDRTTNGTGRVASFTLDELQELDAAYHFSPWNAPDVTPMRGQGVIIPTLREVFETFPEAPMLVEIKARDEQLVERVLDLVQEFDRPYKTLLASFHHSVLQQIRQRDPRVATHLSQREIIPIMVASWFFSGHLFTPSAEAVFVPPRRGILPVATRRFIHAAQRRNLFFGVWTINEEAEMRRLLARGVQGLLTDRPDLAVSAVTDARYTRR